MHTVRGAAGAGRDHLATKADLHQAALAIAAANAAATFGLPKPLPQDRNRR